MAHNLPISFELLCLVQWLLKHEQQLLGVLIKQALQHGFAQELASMEASGWQRPTSEQANMLIGDFLATIEDILFKHLDEIPLDQQTFEALRSMLGKIEGDEIDEKTLWLSVQQTQNTIDQRASNAPASDSKVAHQILVERLLKNWKPNRKQPVN